MYIILNDKECNLEEGATAMQLLAAKGYKGKTTIWVNGRQLLLSEYQTYVMNAGDEVKILRIIGGG